MRKIKEILRLHFEQKLGQRQIARTVNISQSTVHDYLTRMKTAGLKWPLSPEQAEATLEKALFPPGQIPARTPGRPQLDYAHIREQLERHRDLTIELIWEEYREQHPDAILTVASSISIAAGESARTSLCVRITAPATNCSSTGPEPPSLCINRTAARGPVCCGARRIQLHGRRSG